MSRRAVLIPDTQHGPGRTTWHLKAAAAYIDDKQPNYVIQIGDLGDFSSLSSYDKGKASAENRRLSKDWDAFRIAVDCLMEGWSKRAGYKPKMIYTAGNHEFRIDRYKENNPELDTLPDYLGYMRSAGWIAKPFMEVVKVEGVAFSHLFPRSLTGRVSNTGTRYGAPSAVHMIRANMSSCVAGHRPGIDFGMYSGLGKPLCGLIAGSFYPWQETYNGPGYDNQWRGLCALHQFGNGQFDVCPVSIKYLKEKYGK